MVIGSAQFGFPYGISNRHGKVAELEVKKILAKAKSYGINRIDTAISYGDSESVLGNVGVEEWEVITKLPSIPLDLVDVTGWMVGQLEDSLMRLNLSCVDSVLLHRPSELIGDHGYKILSGLRQLKSTKLTKKIGISIYKPSELDGLNMLNQFDIVQAPLNTFDRSLIDSGWLKKLNRLKIEVHVRSIFLQGLLLMSSNLRPSKFSRYEALWTEWDRWLTENNFSPLQGCLAFVNSIDGLSGILVGVESPDQLDEIVAASNFKLKNLPNWSKILDENLTDPSKWAHL